MGRGKGGKGMRYFDFKHKTLGFGMGWEKVFWVEIIYREIFGWLLGLGGW